jgi:hypothetical protein
VPPAANAEGTVVRKIDPFAHIQSRPEGRCRGSLAVVMENFCFREATMASTEPAYERLSEETRG